MLGSRDRSAWPRTDMNDGCAMQRPTRHLPGWALRHIARLLHLVRIVAFILFLDPVGIVNANIELGCAGDCAAKLCQHHLLLAGLNRGHHGSA